MAERTRAHFYVVLLHDGMVDKHGTAVTTSVTLIDVHDIARSSRTFGVDRFFVAHPATAMRKLARTLKSHWQEGYGSTYNPNRGEALETAAVVSSLDEALHQVELETGRLPTLVGTSARGGEGRASFADFRARLAADADGSYMLMLGTGWGMGPELLRRADVFLAPVCGPGEYNHLSVRSACAIMLDRLFGS